MKRILVGKPTLSIFDSLAEAVGHGINSDRNKQAKRDWLITDSMIVRAYSYTLDRVLLHYDSATLEIKAEDKLVNWQLHDLALPPFEPTDHEPMIVIHVPYDSKEQYFDRDTILQSLVGHRIRYAPSPNELYLFRRGLPEEMCMYSYPLIEGEGWLLNYGRLE